MAKKKNLKKSFSSNGLFILMFLGLVILAMGFLAAVIYKPENGDPSTYTGFNVMFGKVLTDSENTFIGGIFSGLGAVKSSIVFSFPAVMGFFLPLLGSVVAGLLLKNNKFIAGIIIAACFIASAVLLFMMPQITSIKIEATSFIGDAKPTIKTFADMGYTLGIGSIIAGAVSSLGALTSLGLVVISK